jgi:hypothetical protein
MKEQGRSAARVKDDGKRRKMEREERKQPLRYIPQTM